MSLLSTLAAHDLGYLTTDAVRRASTPRCTLEGLERYHGHFLNWYDTATLAPLHPRYVSTVDSGNLAGALIALAQGCSRLEEHPQTRAQRLDGLADTAICSPASSSSDARSGRAQIVTEINRLARASSRLARRRRPTDDRARARRRCGAAGRAAAGSTKDGRAEPPTTSPSGADAVLAASSGDGPRHPVPAGLAADARAPLLRSPTACGSTSCTTGGAASSRSATASPTPTARDGSTLVLRSAGVGSAAGELRRHRQG